jgi:DNA mismatch repair protein MSH4
MSGAAASVVSGRSVGSSGAAASASGRRRPWGRARPIPSSAAAKTAAAASSPHILCAIGENLARETCVVSLDLSAPFCLEVSKQSNGQSYSETIACLSALSPHEVLMNEGRYHSPLARKVLAHFDLRRERRRKQQEKQEEQHRQQQRETEGEASTANAQKESMAGPSYDEDTIVKFISRSCFDQTKGADLLKKLARKDTYDSTLVHEYILLSSSHAILHYAQATLGAVTFCHHSLDVKVYTGGHDRTKMEIDRSTLLQLELLTNNHQSNDKSSREHTLIATMDCTKTGLGHRLLRTTLMAPPCRYVHQANKERKHIRLMVYRPLSRHSNVLSNEGGHASGIGIAHRCLRGSNPESNDLSLYLETEWIPSMPAWI